MQKIGLGYDIHRLVAGRKLVLGGIEIPHTMGLDGHSDADVLLHAICDAMLGAVAKGDIGEHFPNTDSRFKGVSSLILLQQANKMVHAEGFTVTNVDAVILAEKPNLKGYKAKMKACIAEKLNMDPGCVNIKATTNEGVGAVGRNEAIAAQAVVLVSKTRL